MTNSAREIIFTSKFTKFYPREMFFRSKFAQLNPREIKFCGKNREIKSHAKISPFREFAKLKSSRIFFFHVQGKQNALIFVKTSKNGFSDDKFCSRN